MIVDFNGVICCWLIYVHIFLVKFVVEKHNSFFQIIIFYTLLVNFSCTNVVLARMLCTIALVSTL